MAIEKCTGRTLVWAVSMVTLAAGARGVPTHALTRRVGVADGIQMTELADPLYAGCGRLASFAPNGKEFVIVVRRGDPRRDVNRYAMLLWKTPGLVPEGPRTILQMKSSSIWPAIDPSTITWAPDSKSLTFLGEHAGEHHEVFQLNVETGRVGVIASHPTSIMSFSRDASGNAMAYTATPAFESLWDAKTARNGFVVTTPYLTDLPDLIVGRNGYYGGRGRPAERRLFVEDSRGTREIQPLPGSHFAGDVAGRDGKRYLWISPDGAYIVVGETVPYRDVPIIWSRYRDFITQYVLSYGDRLPPPLRDTPSLQLYRYVLVDVKTGRSRVLLNSPALFLDPVVWAPNSAAVILNNALLPIGDIMTRRALLPASERETVEVNIKTGEVTPVGGSCYRATQWRNGQLTCDAEPTQLQTSLNLDNPHIRHMVIEKSLGSVCPAPKLIRFRKVAGRWQALGLPTVSRSAVRVFLREDMNNPPKIYWKSAATNMRDTVLYDLNPQFRHLLFGKVRQVTWDWSARQRTIAGFYPPVSGKITGGLYYPPDYRAGQRYPLVIQTHGWNANRFEIDGPWPTADAAQPLAARDIFVLQVPDVHLPVNGYRGKEQLEEVQLAIKIYRSAIAYLSSQGLIDPRKVGIIGFSHTCFYVKWVLTHDPNLFAAASVAEGDDGGYLQYMTGAEGYINDALSLYGGPPFGTHLQTWIRLSPGFNLERVRTPLWINVLNPPTSVLLDWEWFEGLRDLGKPVEMVMLDARTHEEHLLQTPWDRRISEDGNVDWFDFWLNGHEDPDLATGADQYRRWEKLCDMQREQNPRRPAWCTPTPRYRALHPHWMPTASGWSDTGSTVLRTKTYWPLTSASDTG